MNASSPITTLFLDIGGVLLTNGWDRHARQRACETFQLDHAEVDERHHLTYDTYELGKLSLEQYLNRVIFYEKRTFSQEDFKKFIFEQSQPHQRMLDLVRRLKKAHNLNVAVISNESRELTVYRIRKFKLNEFVDFFVSSSFVHFRKPDEDIYRLALDISQADPARSLYIDDRAMFVEVAGRLGFRAVLHTGFEATRQALAEAGLSITDSD